MGELNEIKALIIASGYKLNDVASHLGMGQSNFSRQLNSGTLRYTSVKKIVKFIGKEIIFK
jgi:AraC-like DNA-binding protein